MRDVARRFNNRYGELLVVPEMRIPKVGARIMDLQDPSRKMSTTGGSELGTLYVVDEPKAIERKIKSAVTDSGSEVRRGPDKPGISSLIDVAAALRGVEPETIEAEFEGKRYGDFKGAVAEIVVESLAPVRERYAELVSAPEEIDGILAAGAEKARAICAPVLADVRRAMGVGPRR